MEVTTATSTLDSLRLVPPGEPPRVPPRARTLDRRALLAGLAGLASTRGASARPDPVEVSADVDPGSLLVRLVGRATFGFNESELALATSLGYHGYLEHQLDHTAIEDTALELRMAPLTTLRMTYNELIRIVNRAQIINEMTESALLRAFMSRRQLYERVVEFWTDHFNIDLNTGSGIYLKPIDDREVIRPYALTTFPTLLSASAHSPGMLHFLNNDTSTAGNPNENYARELMELHTMGVNGGYTQHDVVEVARCFTGWTWWYRNSGDVSGSFHFNPAVHDDGEKLVLGNVIPAGGGIEDGLTVLSILAEHPSTARFVAGKLCHKFIGEECSAAVIESVASVYSQSGGDIKAMLRAVFAPNVLADAPPKFKRPFHHFISAMRALPTTITTTSGLRHLLIGAGQRPYSWASPDGYPDVIDYWGGLIIPRWNFGASLLQNQIVGVTADYTSFLAGLTTAEEAADRINRGLFGGEMARGERDILRDFMLPDPAAFPRQREAIGLAIGSPSFQWH
jgi:uncharacterized protein (DUF1800 family)